VGIEASGYARWFERLLAEQGHELWIGDAGAIRAARVQQQKTDARDALLLLRLLVENRFPKIRVSSPAERDLWQLLRHRDKLVRLRTSLRNQLHALAMGEGLCRKQKLWSERGRQELERLALAVGPVERFRNSRKLVSYLGLNPQERSSGGKQRLGAISKQGNSLVRWLLVEAAQTASRNDAELRRVYHRLVHRRGRAVAKVALARKLAVRLYWQLRLAGAQPAPPAPMQGSPCGPLVGATRPTP
jgi:transposase